MTDEKRHVDLSKIEPVFRGGDPEDNDSPDTRQDVDHVGTAAATPASTPTVGVLAETDDQAPPDPDDLDRLRR